MFQRISANDGERFLTWVHSGISIALDACSIPMASVRAKETILNWGGVLASGLWSEGGIWIDALPLAICKGAACCCTVNCTEKSPLVYGTVSC